MFFYDFINSPLKKKLITLAETPDFDPDRMSTVTTEVETSNDTWEITVGYITKQTRWRGWAIVVIGVSFFLAAMTYTILIQNRTFQEMKKQYMEDLAHPQKLRLRQYLDDTAVAEPTAEEESRILYSKPIADFFASTTVICIGKKGGQQTKSASKQNEQKKNFLVPVRYNFTSFLNKHFFLLCNQHHHHFSLFAFFDNRFEH